eukprot:1157334-Pelagomonas_calceolata.AAC.13
MDGLLTVGQGARLDGWLTTRQTDISMSSTPGLASILTHAHPMHLCDELKTLHWLQSDAPLPLIPQI